MNDIRIRQGPDFNSPRSEELLEYFMGSLASSWGFEQQDEEHFVKLIEKVIENLEGLATNRAEEIHSIVRKDLAAWRWTVDWCYCKQSLQMIPQVVDRFLKLSPILVGKTSSKPVDSYLREATRCYLWGFLQAGIALSRAALEAGVNEVLEKTLGHVPEVDLSQKINQAARFKLFSPESAVFANKIRAAANEVLHEGPFSEQLAFDLLILTRRVLLELYQG